MKPRTLVLVGMVLVATLGRFGGPPLPGFEVLLVANGRPENRDKVRPLRPSSRLHLDSSC
jgi:hypothetical protein